MIANTQVTQTFRSAIDKALLETLEKEREEFVTEAVKEYEQKLRKSIGKIAINVTEWYSMQMNGNKLVIEVLLDKREST